jgi:phosphoesterase RecJ-like protein
MLKTNVNFFDLRRLFIKAKNILLVAHPNPDLDCLCAMKVIGFLLRRYFAKNCVLFTKDPIPTPYANLFTDVVNSVSIDDYDCIIAVELGSFSRFKEVLDFDNQIVLNIDHHFSNDLFGDYYYVDTSASSVNEVLYDIIKQTGIPVDSDVSFYLVMGILSDTGVLSYNNVTSKTLSILSELRSYVDWNEIVQIIRSKNFKYYKFLSVLYSNLDKKNKIVYSFVSYQELEDLQKEGFKKDDLNNVIDNIVFINDGEVFFVVLEVEENFCRVSLRSRGLDVESIASKFGGGGHKRASGFRMRKNPKEVVDILISEISQRLGDSLISN